MTPMDEREPALNTRQLAGLLDRMRGGDAQARNDLLNHVCDRLRRLTRKMLRGFVNVKRFAETDDVLQNALMRLLRSLETVQPQDMRQFFGLATVQIRRELIDLARHFYGPQGQGAHHASTPPAAGDESGPHRNEAVDLSRDPSHLAEWCELHQQIERLPGDERETVELIFYQGLQQNEAAELLGVSVRTVQRRWQTALVKLHQVLQGGLPGL
jgi:RNA polymerase sigma-70 factor (ECF subfamily)